MFGNLRGARNVQEPIHRQHAISEFEVSVFWQKI